ncbi:MAG: B12-binding domain-containing radical SAM protein, partial [Proteobacteria bacterium]|nr:B12-binding domain-containing radical SAM protein [Pseudomonadota bacterium]MBU1585754.1 B12-binding domain-containing radical SAM protein [Pseudomonadota bacterium]
GLAYLSSALKMQFTDIQIKIIDRDIDAVVKSFQPDAVGVSAVSQNYGKAIEVGELCRFLQIPVFIGGVHITLLPESLSKVFDFGVFGEGEETIVDIIDYLSKGGVSGSSEMEDIKGIILHAENGIKLTEPRPIISDLDSIQLPDRELLNIPIGQNTYLFTSRGCPYKCTFCASTRFWNKVRWFPAEYVVNEIEEIIKKYRPQAISFYDDLFTGNIKRLERIVELICEKGIHKKVKFGFSCRANLVNERLIEILQPLKISMVCMGLESGCQRTLEYLKGGGVTVEQNQRAVELFSKADINAQGTFVIGSPDESEEEILQTLSFIKKSRLNLFEVYVLSPFPGTPIWETAKKMNLVSNSMDWKKLAVDCYDFEDRILLSKLPPKRLFELCTLFEKEKRKRKIVYYIRYIIKTGLRDPRWVLKKMYFLGLKAIPK